MKTYRVSTPAGDYTLETDAPAAYAVVIWEDDQPAALYPYSNREAARRGLTYRLAQTDKRGTAASGQLYATEAA